MSATFTPSPPEAARRVGRGVVAVAVATLAGLTAWGLVAAGSPSNSGVGAPAGARRSATAVTACSATTVATVSPDLAPTCGAWWGEALEATDSTLLPAVNAAQAAQGRRLDIVHTYHRWDDVFPTPGEQALALSGHLLFINWQPTAPNGSPIRWSSIASGAQNQTIDEEAARLAALGEPVLLSFSHEPEDNLGRYGDAAQFVAAYRYVHNRLVADGATNVRWVWTVEGIDTPYWLARYASLWPGSAFVDWIAWDPYNFASCRQRPWLSFSALVAPFYRWLSEPPFADKPLMLAEYGTITQSAKDSKQNWYAGEASALARFPRLKALVYFDFGSPPASCNWQADSSSADAQAFAQLARSAAFNVTATLDPELEH